MRLVKCLSSVVLIGTALCYSGCASFDRIAKFPNPKNDSKVAVVSKPMSKMNELPIGAYYDGQRQIIVTGHQKGLLTGMLFGVVGVIVADQVNKSSGKDKFGDEAAQSETDLVTLTQTQVEQLEAEGKAPHWRLSDATMANLRLSPYAVFTVDKKTGLARLYAMLRAEIPGTDGKPTWSGRYFARAPGEYLLDGEDGWMSQGRFVDGMEMALERVLKVCVADTNGTLMEGRKITAKGRFAYLNIDLELRGIVVDETPDTIIARLLVGDVMVMAGTHVLDRADFEIKAADFKDPR
ncbi:MAG: hypothetical protein KDK74_12775 [Cephaloticoccus sp.]|nr:hypothetical protein [Cephaloticoccus sp.]